MKTVFRISIGVSLLVACENSSKPKYAVELQAPIHENETFENFNKKFHADGPFQRSRIHFPIKGFKVDGFSKHSWSEGNWELMKVPVGVEVDTQKYQRTIQRTDTSVLETIWMENSGFRLDREFRIRDGKWYLVSYNDINL